MSYSACCSPPQISIAATECLPSSLASAKAASPRFAAALACYHHLSRATVAIS